LQLRADVAKQIEDDIYLMLREAENDKKALN